MEATLISIVFTGTVRRSDSSMIIFGQRTFADDALNIHMTEKLILIARHHQLGPDKPVWITEYACTNWNEQNPLPQEHVEQFARESAAYLETLDWVERYAWFGPMRNTGAVGKWARMLDDGGKLTALGKAYRDG